MVKMKSYTSKNRNTKVKRILRLKIFGRMKLRNQRTYCRVRAIGLDKEVGDFSLQITDDHFLCPKSKMN
jgi:hypothetical protein